MHTYHYGEGQQRYQDFMRSLILNVWDFGFRIGMEIDGLRMLLSVGECREAGVDSET